MRSTSIAFVLIGGGSNRRHGSFEPGAAFLSLPTLKCPRQRRNLSLAGALFLNENSSSENDGDIDKTIDATSGNDVLSSLKYLTRWSERTPSLSSRTFESFPFPFSVGRPKILEEEMSSEVASLSGMVNVEALVAMAAANETDIELLLPNIGDLKRSIDKETREGEGVKTKLFPFLDSALRLENVFPGLLPGNNEMDVSSMNMVAKEELPNQVPYSTSSTEKMFQDAVHRLEYLVNSTSYAFSPYAFQSLILRASNALATQEAPLDLTAFTATASAQVEYTRAMVEYANSVLINGYEPLLSKFPSIKSIPRSETRQKIIKAAEFGLLSGAIYEEPLANSHRLDHSIIAEGKTVDVGWMVTDSIQYETDFFAESEQKDPTLVRTFIFRGYDASDEKVDREELLNVICTASPVPVLKKDETVLCHGGMLSIAEAIYEELKQYIDMTSPSHKFVFTGHSIGGSLAVLVMILLARDRGASFVKEKTLRVFTFGAPPIFEINNSPDGDSCSVLDSCPVLTALDLPTNIVYSYCQPWDPIVRLFSRYDPLYPLIDDVGEDGFTPWVSGPPRTLRPIVKTIVESWEGWPRFRDNARVELGQNFTSVGEQYLLLPEPIRYLADQLVSLDTTVPPIESIVQVSSHELLPALNEIFKLDTFAISYVSVAIRSFIHHFYPAYGLAVAEYAKKKMKEEEESLGFD